MKRSQLGDIGTKAGHVPSDVAVGVLCVLKYGVRAKIIVVHLFA